MKPGSNRIMCGMILTMACSVVCAEKNGSAQIVATQPVSRDVHCFNQGYAMNKSGDAASEAVVGDDAAAGDDLPQNDGKILQRAQPLMPPPEIKRIRRGYVSHFVGEFRNNGMESWTAVDLDRGIAVSVQRRVHDKRVEQSRAAAEPKFGVHGAFGHSFARKFVGDGRSEVETVATERMDKLTLEAFTCVANAAWAAPTPEGQFNAADGMVESHLEDMHVDSGRITTYAKRVPSMTALDGVLSYTFLVRMPKISW
jgi:hypothetical protein